MIGKPDSCRYGSNCLFLHAVVVDEGNGNISQIPINVKITQKPQQETIKNKAFKDNFALLPKEIFDLIILQVSVEDRQQLYMVSSEREIVKNKINMSLYRSRILYNLK